MVAQGGRRGTRAKGGGRGRGRTPAVQTQNFDLNIVRGGLDLNQAPPSDTIDNNGSGGKPPFQSAAMATQVLQQRGRGRPRGARQQPLQDQWPSLLIGQGRGRPRGRPPFSGHGRGVTRRDGSIGVSTAEGATNSEPDPSSPLAPFNWSPPTIQPILRSLHELR